MQKRALWACLVVLSLIAAACGGGEGGDSTTTAAAEEPTTTAAPEETTTTAMAEAELGSPDRPVQVLFVPSVDAQVIVSGGDVMKAALEEATGLSFEVSVPTSYAATIEEMCAAPEDTMGFIPGFGYVLANNLCGVDVAFKAVRFGYGVYWAQILVPRDSDIASIEDLDGLSWAFPDVNSTSGYLVPLVQLDEAGVTAGEPVETGGHPNAALAVYRGDADFGTTFFSPPLILEGDPWQLGDEPDVPEDLVDSCAPNEEGVRRAGGRAATHPSLKARSTMAASVALMVTGASLIPSTQDPSQGAGHSFPVNSGKLLVACSRSEAACQRSR